NVVRPVRAVVARPVLVAQRQPRVCDRQLGVDARDVQDRLCLELQHGGLLADVGDLEYAACAAVVDQEGLVALAAEVGRAALEPEQSGGDRRDLVGREPRRGRFEDALGHRASLLSRRFCRVVGCRSIGSSWTPFASSWTFRASVCPSWAAVTGASPSSTRTTRRTYSGSTRSATRFARRAVPARRRWRNASSFGWRRGSRRPAGGSTSRSSPGRSDELSQRTS